MTIQSQPSPILAAVAEILGCLPAEITPASSIVNHPKWDSFSHIQIMMMLNERFGIEIDDVTIQKYSVMSEILALAGETA